MKEIYGDLTKANETFIAHGCNCRGVMGKGVALSLRNTFPEIYKPYQDYCKNNDYILGTYIAVPSNEKVIVNLFSQEFYGNTGRYASVEAITNSLVHFLNDYPDVKTVAISRIGAGTGGLSWKDEVKPLLEIIEEKFEMEFVVYELTNS